MTVTIVLIGFMYIVSVTSKCIALFEKLDVRKNIYYKKNYKYVKLWLFFIGHTLCDTVNLCRTNPKLLESLNRSMVLIWKNIMRNYT